MSLVDELKQRFSNQGLLFSSGMKDIPHSESKIIQDILQPEVDEKYYVTHKYVERLLMCEKNLKKIRRLVVGKKSGEIIQILTKSKIREDGRLSDRDAILSPQGVSSTLRSRDHKEPRLVWINDMELLAYSKSNRKETQTVEHRITETGIANTLNTGDGCANQSTQNFIVINPNDAKKMRIRKITPIEAERLMGYPDQWTRFGVRATGTQYELSDSARYKACGNGIVSTIPKLILDRLLPDGVFKTFSTFSGVDGSTLLLDITRFPKVEFCEYEPKASASSQHAANVLRYMYPNIPNFGDITKVNPADVPAHDLIFISCPCQSFSYAGHQLGLEDTRGTLFYETAKIMAHHRPKYFLFENVKGILSNDQGKTFETILKVYSDLGYEMDFEVFNSKFYGVP